MLGWGLGRTGRGGCIACSEGGIDGSLPRGGAIWSRFGARHALSAVRIIWGRGGGEKQGSLDAGGPGAFCRGGVAGRTFGGPSGGARLTSDAPCLSRARWSTCGFRARAFTKRWRSNCQREGRQRLIPIIVRGRGVVRRAEGTAHCAPCVGGERGRSRQLWTMFAEPLDSFRDG